MVDDKEKNDVILAFFALGRFIDYMVQDGGWPQSHMDDFMQAYINISARNMKMSPPDLQELRSRAVAFSPYEQKETQKLGHTWLPVAWKLDWLRKRDADLAAEDLENGLVNQLHE